jgi:hypothetical protein
MTDDLTIPEFLPRKGAPKVATVAGNEDKVCPAKSGSRTGGAQTSNRRSGLGHHGGARKCAPLFFQQKGQWQ